eukprot:484550_1
MISRAARHISKKNVMSSASLIKYATTMTHFQNVNISPIHPMIPIHPIHTKANKTNKTPNSTPSTQKSRMTVTALNPFVSTLNALTTSIPTGSGSGSERDSRIMERVWQKRKDRLQKATKSILEKFQSKDLKIGSVEIYMRNGGSFDDTDDNAQRDVHIALRGIAHTVVVLKLNDGKSCYLLDRVVEGIRLSELTLTADG